MGNSASRRRSQSSAKRKVRTRGSGSQSKTTGANINHPVMSKEVYKAYMEATSLLDNVPFDRLHGGIERMQRPPTPAPYHASSSSAASTLPQPLRQKPLPRVRRLKSVHESTGEVLEFTWTQKSANNRFMKSSSSPSLLSAESPSKTGMANKEECQTLAREFRAKVEQKNSAKMTEAGFSQCISDVMLY